MRLEHRISILSVLALVSGCFNPGDPAVVDTEGSADGDGTGTADSTGGPIPGESGSDGDGTGATSGDPASCDDLDCGAHGSCLEDGGGATCECDQGWDGATCSECAPGFVDEDGVCTPNCGPCGDHAFCDGSLSPPACSCVAGYGDEGGGCVWAGVIQDPLFAEQDVWSTVASTIDPEGFGVDDGSASFNPSGYCGVSKISQVATMPTYESAEPLSLVVRGITVAQGESCMYGPQPTPAMRFGGAVQRIPPGGSNNFELELCLGEAAYGSDVDFQLVPDVETNPGCFADVPVCDYPVFREVDIRPAAGQCPVPGIVTSGTFDSDEGWTYSANAANGNPATAEVANGELHLETFYLCSGASASTSLSPPTSQTLAGTALRFDVTGTSGRTMNVSLAGRNLAHLTGSGALESKTYCVPSFARGTVHPFELSYSLSGTCATEASVQWTFDNFEFVSEPSCGDGPVLDGDFEGSVGGSIVSPWNISGANAMAVANVVENASLAHGGNGALEVQFLGGSTSADLRAVQQVLVPVSTAEGGPAVRLWHRVSAAGPEVLTVMPLGEEITGSATWEEKVVCIDSSYEGQILTMGLRWLISGTSSATHLVDDVSVELHPDC